jgi:hypothetical protein
MVAFRKAERVFAAANEPKKLYRLEGVGHDVVLDAPFFERSGSSSTRQRNSRQWTVGSMQWTAKRRNQF